MRAWLSGGSALPVTGASIADFDPLERERLRQAVKRYRGDEALLGLGDVELDGVLGLTRREGERRVPTVAGLLLLGREEVLRQHLPTHEVAFQLLEGTDVRVNELYRRPPVASFERLEEHLTAQLEEEEVQAGLFRVPVPRMDRRAFREALVNALAHRDYTRLGAVHMRWQLDEALSVSNPGGFVDGVTLQKLLVVETRPRNPLLADALKRVGLAERTGRGVDLICQGLLRDGLRQVVTELRRRGSDLVAELGAAINDRDHVLEVMAQPVVVAAAPTERLELGGDEAWRGDQTDTDSDVVSQIDLGRVPHGSGEPAVG